MIANIELWAGSIAVGGIHSCCNTACTFAIWGGTEPGTTGTLVAWSLFFFSNEQFSGEKRLVTK